jgi:hypothetical protein
MLTVKTSRHIRSIRNRKSFRACPTSTGIPSKRSETYRQHLEDGILKDGALRRIILSQQWSAHLLRCRLIRTA